MGCGNPVIIPLPKYICLLLTNQLQCDLICLWAFLTAAILCRVFFSLVSVDPATGYHVACNPF